MPKDKPTNPNPESLRPIPGPIKLSLPTAAKPTKQQEPKRERHKPTPVQKSQTRTQNERPRSHDRAPVVSRTPGKGFFDSAQKQYGQRRPHPPKPPKLDKHKTKSKGPARPRLGSGDRLYTPYIPKEPLIPPRVKRVLKFWALGIIALAFIFMAFVNRFNHNAWAVYLDDQFLGYMPINREAEPESVHESAVSHLSDSIGAEIQVSEEAIVRTTRARRSSGEFKTTQEMILLISRHFTYQIVGSAIYIDGERIAIMRNVAEAEHVAQEITRQYINENTLEALTSFQEDWQLVRVLADIEDMDSPTDVIQFLERPIAATFEHTVRAGDTQGGLAAEFNIALDRIGYLNNISSDTIIRVGEPIILETIRPRLTVITVDEVYVLEDIPKEEETRYNADKLSDITTIIQDGRDGQQRVVRRYTLVNGIQDGAPEIVSTQVLRPAESRILEIGTAASVIDVR